ncbi:L,D-transpeptidase family protein [Mesorhizobium xinjiangense]|uniref:L,D-transpeptidase family protein n=1 Tax=Mesorhizobium xinjiangense TaxID=2678685 RepID=UPI001F0084AA|nr:L,D-transpeptidase family protein [Mesorhizobium xinjiangense]
MRIAARPLPIVVRPRPGRPAEGLLWLDGQVFPCALGAGGITAFKREGDGATPLGAMRVLWGYYRPGRGPGRPSRLAFWRETSDLGWCDAPGDRNYNRPVRLPYRASHERMQRPDHLYDMCIVLDWNMRPAIRGRGSAIFLHLARPGYRPTEGCVAVSRRTMLRLLQVLRPGSVLRVCR